MMNYNYDLVYRILQRLRDELQIKGDIEKLQEINTAYDFINKCNRVMILNNINEIIKVINEVYDYYVDEQKLLSKMEILKFGQSSVHSLTCHELIALFRKNIPIYAILKIGRKELLHKVLNGLLDD